MLSMHDMLYYQHIPYFQALYPLNVQKSLPRDSLAIPAV